MAKLSLKANPTFDVKVGIPVAGGKASDVVFTFKHRTKTQLDDFVKTRAEKTDADSILEMVEAWDLADEFSVDSVNLMLENYIGSAVAIYRAYVDELVANRTKN